MTDDSASAQVTSLDVYRSRLQAHRSAEADVEDRRRFAYARGTQLITALSDDLSELAFGSGPLSRGDLDVANNRLLEVYELLCGQTMHELDPALPDASCAEFDAFIDTYSDGSPVSALLRYPTAGPERLVPNEYYNWDIEWMPNISAIPSDRDDLDFWPGPVPPGCEVVIFDPPCARTARPAEVSGDKFEAMRQELLERNESAHNVTATSQRREMPDGRKDQ